MVYVDGKGKMSASEEIAPIVLEGNQWVARSIREWGKVWLHCREIPRSQQGANTKTPSLLADEVFRAMCKKYLTSVKKGEVTVNDFLHHVNNVLLPEYDGTGRTIRRWATACQWLRILGWSRHNSKRGVYVDGHERPDVVEYRKKYLEQMQVYEKKMGTNVWRNCPQISNAGTACIFL